MSKYFKLSIFLLAILGTVVMATPAKAFTLEVPTILKNAMQALSAQKSYAQSQPMMGSDMMQPPPIGQQQPIMNPPMYQPQPMVGGDQYGGGMNQPQPMYQPQPMMQQPPVYNQQPMVGSNNQYNPVGESNPQPSPMPNQPMYQPNQQMNQPPMMGDYQQQGPNSGGQGMMGPGGQNMGPGGGGNDNFLKDMKRGIKQMQPSIKKFESWMASEEKKGTVIPQEIKDKLEKSKAAIEIINNAKDSAELQESGFDPSEMDTQELEQFRREITQNAEMLRGMQRGMQGMNQGLKMFKSQVAKLTKKGIAVPADLQEKITKLDTIMAAVKQAKTFEEAQAAGIEELQDTMMDLDESRQQLEMLTRWPQTQKEMDKQLKQLTAQLKKSKAAVARLAKKGTDLSATYASFEEAVNKLKAVRDDAFAKMQAGDSEGGFDAVESDFFGQMEDVWQFQKTIDMLSNLGQMNSQIQKGLNDAQKTINNLKRKKVDTSELTDLLNQAKEKAAEIKILMKESPIDEDSIISTLEDMDNIRTEFDDKAEELGGGQRQIMPWEQGPQQFKPIQMDASMQRYMPQKSEQMETNPVGESNPSPAP